MFYKYIVIRYHVDSANEQLYVRNDAELKKLLKSGEIKEDDKIFPIVSQIMREIGGRQPKGWQKSAYSYNHTLPEVPHTC